MSVCVYFTQDRFEERIHHLLLIKRLYSRINYLKLNNNNNKVIVFISHNPIYFQSCFSVMRLMSRDKISVN